MKLRESIEKICSDPWSHTVLLQQGHPLLVKRGLEWIPDRSFQLNYADITQLQKEPGSLIGQTFELDFIAEEKSLSLTRRSGALLKIDRWGVPSSYFEQLAKIQGLHALLSGSSMFIQDFIKIVQDDLKSRSTLIITDGKLFSIGDFFILAVKNEEQLRKAIRIAQSGRSVIAWFNHAKLDYWMNDKILFSDSEWETFLSVMRSTLSIQYLKGIEEPVVPAIEYIVNHALVKKPLLNRDLEDLREQMTKNAESVGFKTLQETLLNLVVRRKIELREAFMVSPDPGQFDALLKTIGV